MFRNEQPLSYLQSMTIGSGSTNTPAPSLLELDTREEHVLHHFPEFPLG